MQKVAVLRYLCILALLISAFFIPAYSANNTVSLWDGSSIEEIVPRNSVYEIRTAAQLAWLATLKDFPAENIYKLKTDIDLGGHTWTSIGFRSSVFKGTFDGENHTIIGFKLPTEEYVAGFFGYIGECAATRVKIKNLKIQLLNSGRGEVIATPSICVGVLAGIGKCIDMDNISISGNLNISSTYSQVVGGIVANLYSGTVTNSSVDINFLVNAQDHVWVGGIVGEGSNTTIKECHSSGNINGISENGTVHVGGIMGESGSDSSIEKCSVSGEITAIGSGIEIYAGGIVGRFFALSSTIKTCYSEVRVSVKNKQREGGFLYAGGIAGEITYGLIDACYATGDIIAEACDGSAFIVSYAGGISGYSDASIISNCASLNSNVIAKGEWKKDYAARIVGDMRVTEKNSLKNNYANSSMKVNGKTVLDGTANNNNGIGHTLDTFQQRTMYIDTLEWDAAVWNFPAGGFPTLK